MTGNKKLQATNNHIGNGSDYGYADGYAQTDTLTAPKQPTSSHPSPVEGEPNTHTTGPFNFGSLSPQYKIGIIRNGISKKELEAIKSETEFDYRTLSTLLSVSRTTLIKKKGDERFDQSTSERIMHLAELISYGRQVFESREGFNAWLKKPVITLGGKSPVELLDTVYGIEEVKKELGRIEVEG
jgi:putative toxin-antitoxin system antitoxin component (TIGR02293 family)